VELLDLGDPADAVPAVLSHLGEVLHAVEVDGDVLALLVGGLFAGGEGLVDVVDALDLSVVGAFRSGELEGAGEGNQHQENQQFLHVDFLL
jgi:hypothetical protein